MERYTSTLCLVLNSLCLGLCSWPVLGLILKKSHTVSASWCRIPAVIVTLTFQLPSSTLSCHDGSAIIVVTVSSRRFCCSRHRLNVAFQPCRQRPDVTILPLRPCNYLPDDACHHCRHRRLVVMLLTSRGAVAFLPPVTAVILTFVLTLPASWHCHSIPSRRHLVFIVTVFCPSFALRRRSASETALRYNSTRDMWSYGMNS